MIENLGSEEYEYKVSENLTLFKLFSSPIKEIELHKLSVQKESFINSYT